MAGHDSQTDTWNVMYRKISDQLGQFGAEDAFGKGDYWVLDDNYGFRSNKVCINRLSFLQPMVVRSLQDLLKDVPDWEIVVAIDVPGQEAWPPMGFRIRAAEIVDDLKRQYFPSEFQRVQFW